MNDQTFSTRQATCLATMFIMGQVFILYNGSPAKADIWISILMAYAFSVSLSLLFARLLNVFPGKNMFDLQLDLFGPVIGRAMVLVYLFFYLHVSSLTLEDMTVFIKTTSIVNTPQFVTSLFIGLVCIYGVKSGINTVGRYAAIALPVYLLMLIAGILLSTTLWMDMRHLPPILYNGFKPVMKSAIDLSAFPYMDAAVLPFVLPPLKEHRKAKSIFLISYAISTFFFIITFLRNILVLGDNFTYTQYFPTYVTISLIDIADFLQRIEVLMGAVLFMGVFIKIAVYMYVFALGISKFFSVADYRKFAAPAGFLMIVFSQFEYPNMLVNQAFASNIYPYYALPFDVLLPTLIWLTAEWKRRKLLREGRLPQPPPAGEETPVARQDGGIPQNPAGDAGEQPQPS